MAVKVLIKFPKFIHQPNELTEINRRSNILTSDLESIIDQNRNILAQLSNREKFDRNLYNPSVRQMSANLHQTHFPLALFLLFMEDIHELRRRDPVSHLHTFVKNNAA